MYVGMTVKCSILKAIKGKAANALLMDKCMGRLTCQIQG
jgi:hypothetical protein